MVFKFKALNDDNETRASTFHFPEFRERSHHYFQFEADLPSCSRGTDTKAQREDSDAFKIDIQYLPPSHYFIAKLQ
jgi:hypothetical protein